MHARPSTELLRKSFRSSQVQCASSRAPENKNSTSIIQERYISLTATRPLLFFHTFLPFNCLCCIINYRTCIKTHTVDACSISSQIKSSIYLSSIVVHVYDAFLRCMLEHMLVVPIILYCSIIYWKKLDNLKHSRFLPQGGSLKKKACIYRQGVPF